ncbi:DEAD/DEAH box helicase [Streptomyces hebeiensis]
MAEYEIPDNYEELKQWLENKEEENKKLKNNIPTINTSIEADLKAERELMAKVHEITRKRREAERVRDAMKEQSRKDAQAIAAAQRRLETFASDRAIRERLKNQAEEFDRITQQHTWREFAFNHQIDGARRLASAKRGILGDKRGLGKSLTSLIWADMLDAKKVLVFAPKDVLENFKREINHWTPHRSVLILGGLNKFQRELYLNHLAALDQFLLLINYEAWRKDPMLLELIKNVRADTVIIDEAHNIKERRTSAYNGIRDIVYADNECSQCGGYPEQFTKSHGSRSLRCSVCLHEQETTGEFCSVKNVLPMTGTAILNKPQDLWTLLNLVDRVAFPSEKAFLQDYCTTNIYTGRWIFKHGGENALIKRLGPRFVKRDKNTAGVKFKEQVHVPHYIEFDKTLYPSQWRVMQEIAKYGAIKMDENVKLDIIGILPELMRRRQAITWPKGIKIWEKDEEGRKTGRVLYEAPATESIKMDKAMEIAKEIIEEDEDRLVIFSQFKEALKEFEHRFNYLGVPVVRYDGDISDSKAVEAQLDFDGKTSANHPPYTSCNPECKKWGKSCNGWKWTVILCHYKKGGVGLNLNSARQMIKLDREWNPGKEDQADGRIDRLDNTKDSVVHTIHVSGTIDSFMDSLIEEKAKIIDGFEQQHDIAEKLLAALRDKDLM